MKTCLPHLAFFFLALASGLCSAADPAAPKPELRTAKEVEVKYHLALPRGWKAESTWPILVTLAGAGKDHQANFDQFVKARGELPFIVVTPHVNSLGKDPADLKAVLAIVKEVQKEFAGQPKFYVTGFSAGAHLTWQLIFLHPELLAGASPVCGNFNQRGIDQVVEHAAAEKLPIHGFQGDKDQVLHHLNPQWETAVELAHKHGYKNIDRTVIAGGTHLPYQTQVVAFFGSLLPKE
jgi:predicted peptidase